MTLAFAVPHWAQFVISGIVGLAMGLAALAGMARVVQLRADHCELDGLAPGVGGRRELERRLEAEWEHAVAHGGELSLLVIDVNAFDEISQLYGRKAAESAAAEVGESIRLRVRRTDFVARLAVDEYAVVCPETPPEAVGGLRRNLEAFVNYATTAPVSLSIGVASRSAEDGDYSAMLERARESVVDRRVERPLTAVDEALGSLLA